MIERKQVREVNVLNKYNTILNETDTLLPMGRVVQVSGMSIISEGPPDASIGEICRVETQEKSILIPCEVVGFQNHRLVLMPLGSPQGVFPNANVLASRKRLSISVSTGMLGRVFDGLGRPLDGKPALITEEKKSLDHDPPRPTSRPAIRQHLETGIRAIDSLLTVGRGQRIGIFAGTGVGKSTLLGMIARYTRADINVIALVGERGREVNEFLEEELGEEGLERSVVFCATSDKSAMEKVYAAGFATSTAEYFRDKGYHVNLMMDSVTRFCMALREVGIASGEQIGPGGYPPGVWYRLSRLVERSGSAKEGSITGFYTVLVEADDMNDPVADNTRGILDGHIVLSRRLAQRGHYPSIEVTESISRVMDKVISKEHKENALRLRQILSAYRENEDIINLGAYAKGSNSDVDEAIEKQKIIKEFLTQRVEEGSRFEDSVAMLHKLISVAKSEEDYY